MKKIVSILLSLIMLSSLASCGTGSSKNDKYSIVCTIFPQYDWVKSIIGERADSFDVTLLLDDGIDLHSYQPTADDIVTVSKCDMFVYVGGESDAWVDDVLSEAVNKDMVAVNLLEVLGDSVKEEEVIEGMETNAHEEGEAHDNEEEGPEYDEHVWLSLKNSAKLVSVLTTKIAELDESNASEYIRTGEAYGEKLSALDDQYKAAVDGAKFGTLLFGDRFPFRYLIDDYGLNYFAAFVGCSAETEASFETIVFLASKVDELGLTSVMVIEGTEHKLANTIIQNTESKDQKIVEIDSLQSVTKTDVDAGETYLGIMEKNLTALKTALN